MSSRTKERLVVTALAAALATSLPAVRSPNDDLEFPAVSFFQLDVNFDGDDHPNSEWGQVHLEYNGSDQALYFNLTVQSGNSGEPVWRVQNIPVVSREGPDVVQQAAFDFNLANTPGVEVSSLEYAFALTTSPLSKMPMALVEAAVEQAPYVIDTGYGGTPILFAPPPEALVGGAAGGGGPCSHEGFPNVDVGKDECVPGGTSNSLNWMNEFYGLGISVNLITVEAMKEATGFDPSLPGCDDNWPEKKAAYLQEHEIPVTSEAIDRFAFNQILNAICSGCDVEVGIGKHAAAITGITRLADGNYSLDLTHDDVQGAEGGQITETVTYNDEFGRFSGAPWLDNKAPELVVVECPEFGATPTPTNTPTTPTPKPSRTPPPDSTKTPRPTKTPPTDVTATPRPTKTPPADLTKTPRPTKTPPTDLTKTPRPTKTPPTDPTKTKTPRPKPTKTRPPTTGTPAPKITKTPAVTSA